MTPAEIETGRKLMLETILRDPESGVAAANFRDACQTFDIPKSAAEIQQKDPLQLSAPELCIGALTRQGTDGLILADYKAKIDKENASVPGARKADDAAATALVQRVVDSIKTGSNIFLVTPTLTGHVSSGLALDAGFTTAWLNKGQGLPATVSDETKFRAATESCTTQQDDPKRCFAIGVVQGARAYANTRRTSDAGSGDHPQQTVSRER
jgi:hypothetical protein